MESYEPTDKGGYKADSSAYDKYHSWAASQYREKVLPMFYHHVMGAYVLTLYF